MGRWRHCSSSFDKCTSVSETLDGKDVEILPCPDECIFREQPPRAHFSLGHAVVNNLQVVFQELSELLKQHRILLLSRAAGLLSLDARCALKSSGTNLKELLQNNRHEFHMKIQRSAVYISLVSDKAGCELDICAGADSGVGGVGRRWGKKTEAAQPQFLPCRSVRTLKRNARRSKQRQLVSEDQHVGNANVNNIGDAICLVWVRDDLRLHDNPALSAAVDSGRAIIPVFIHDTSDPSPWPITGAALWWKHHSLDAFARSLQARCHSHLIIRLGDAIQVLSELCEEVGASHVYFNGQVEPWYRERDLASEAALVARAVSVESFKAVVIAEPWERHCKAATTEELASRDDNPVHLRARIDHARPKGLYEKDEIVAHQDDGSVAPGCEPLPSVAGRHFRSPCEWPSSLPLSSLGYGNTTGFGFPKGFKQFREPSKEREKTNENWAAQFGNEWQVGEDAGLKRLHAFIECVLKKGLHDSAPHRCRADERFTSALSAHIRFGEVSPRTCYAEALKCKLNRRKPFVRRLLWRDLAYAELFRWPDLPTMSVRKQYEKQSWSGTQAQLKRWQRGQTGFPLVDAAMRQLWKIGWLPNYMRHVTAQFLIDYLDISWKEGFRWYDFTLIDADVAINAHMWQNGGHSGVSQWYFLLHPVAAAERADPHGHYVRRWVPELAGLPDEFIHCPWEMPVGLHAVSLLSCHQEYYDRIIQDLVAAVRRHVCQVIALRQSNKNLVNKEGYDVLQLPNGRHIRLGTRDDFRLFDATKYLTTLFSVPKHKMQRSLLRPSIVGTQNALLEEETRRAHGGQSCFSIEIDNLL